MIWIEFPHIQWEWRVFLAGYFFGYIQATTRDIAAMQAKMATVVDFDRQTIDLI